MNRARLAVVAMLVGLVVCAVGSAQEPASKRLDGAARFVDAPTPVRVGDVLTFEITIAGDGARDAVIVAGPDFGRLEATANPERTTVDGRTTIRYEVRPFDTGRFAVPPIEIASARDRATTAEATIDVVSLSSADDTASDAKIVLPSMPIGPLAPVALASLVVVGLGYRLARRAGGRPVPGELALLRMLAGVLARRSRGLASPASPAAPAVATDSAALAEIDAIAKVSPEAYDPVEAHAALARVATRFVEGALCLRPRERTTRELVRVAGARFSASAVAELARVLEACDRVKFAKSRPDLARFRETASALGRAVRATRDE